MKNRYHFANLVIICILFMAITCPVTLVAQGNGQVSGAVYSNSGGSWGPDGLLYCTGHDHPELYGMQIPDTGSVLELIKTVPIDNTGQDIAWDRSNPRVIYSISKKDRQVRIFELNE